MSTETRDKADHLDRVSELCNWHRTTWAYAVADHLDHPDIVSPPAESFARYEAKCQRGEGCSR